MIYDSHLTVWDFHTHSAYNPLDFHIRSASTSPFFVPLLVVVVSDLLLYSARLYIPAFPRVHVSSNRPSGMKPRSGAMNVSDKDSSQGCFSGADQDSQSSLTC